MTAPLTFTFDGESMVPKQPRLAEKFYEAGHEYRLGVIEERSAASHSHYFAALNEAWENLPEDIAEDFPNVERLRKWALIKSGFCDERSVVCASKAEAQRVAGFIRPMDEFAIVLVSEATIRVYTAQSQSMRAMGKVRFQDSKDKVLAIVSDLIGVKPAELRREAGKAA